MKFLIIFFTTILTIIIYSLICSMLSALNVDFISFTINFDKFDITKMFSLCFLISFYLMFSYYFILIFITISAINTFDFLRKLNKYIIAVFFITLFTIFSFMFDSNFYETSISLSRFIYSLISIFVNVMLINLISKRMNKLSM